MTRKTNTHRLLHKLFNALSNSIDDIGYANTIQVLNNNRNRTGSSNMDNFNICITAVMQVFQISKPELLHGTQKKYPRKYAFGLLIYLAKEEFDYSLADIGRFLNKDRSNLSRIRNEIAGYLGSHDNKFDALIIGKYQQCRAAIHKLQQPTEITE